jgi:hypothetical protein
MRQVKYKKVTPDRAAEYLRKEAFEAITLYPGEREFQSVFVQTRNEHELVQPFSAEAAEATLNQAHEDLKAGSPAQIEAAKSLGLQLVVPPAVYTAFQMIEKLGAEETENFLTQGVASAKAEEETFLTDALRAPAGPPIPEKAFYGLAGRIVNKLRPQTESHPMGNLLEFLACFGNIIGSTAFYQIEDTRHYGNIDVVTVGQSSKARKGTGQDRINRIARELDARWFADRRTSGLGSGEIVISLGRDAASGLVKNKQGEVKFQVTDPGVDDKRLFISEGEFAGILAVAGRQDNLLSKVIRDSWDHKPIRNMAKSGSSQCSNPHISISANITREELNIQLKEADRFNGFGNRFLWCYVERQALLPHGGEDIDWTEEIKELFACVQHAQKQSRLYMDRNAREMWGRIYKDLSKSSPGVVGAVTSRAEAQVIRLALLFSILDCAESISSDHLKAARVVWDYCEESARVIFGGALSKEQSRILEFLTEAPRSAQTIRKDLFKKNRKLEEINSDLYRLISFGKVVESKDAAGKPVYSRIGE